jgi:hypothetical protein
MKMSLIRPGPGSRSREGYSPLPPKYTIAPENCEGDPVKKSRSVGRRSFLALVAGGGLAFGTGLVLASAGATQASSRRTAPPRRMIVDRDPSDPARLPAPPAPEPTRPSPRPPRIGSIGGNVLRRQQRSPGPRQRFVVCPGHRRCPR